MANKKRAASAKNKKSMIDNDSLSGFTIIEVVLVLAIAGLIFMMVFIALPQLQRAQRDTQRRQNLGSLQSAITQFQANNNGKIPGQTEKNEVSCKIAADDLTFDNFGDNVACRLIKTYMNGVNATENTFVDPDGTPYSITITGDTGIDTDTFDHMVYIVKQTGCSSDDEGLDTTSGTTYNPRDFAVVYKLEGSGVYCQDNNG